MSGDARIVVSLDAVSARDRAGPRKKPLGRLASATFQAQAGIVAIVGTPADGAVALTEVLSGEERPISGRVSVVGHDPAMSPSIRARIGVLGWAPDLPPGRTVADVVRTAVRARGERAHRFDAVLDPFGLGRLHSRSPRSLSLAEARAVELALALSTPRPLLLVLHEPWTDTAIGDRDLVHQALTAASREGACVLVVTSSKADARLAAERVVFLSGGKMTEEWPARGFGELCAWIAAPVDGAGGVREVASALARRADVLAVAWEAAPEDDSGIVRLRGDVETCAIALTETASEQRASIRAVTSDVLAPAALGARPARAAAPNEAAR